MITTEPVWVSEREVVETLDLQASIHAIRDAFAAQVDGSAWTMAKTYASWGDGHTLHAVGGASPAGLIGTKTWAHTAEGATPLLVMWDRETGGLAAVVEAFALGQLRTAAVTAVATDVLGPAEVPTFAIIGTGRQALAQVAAVTAVRKVGRVAVWSPTPSHRLRFAKKLSQAGIEADVVVADDVETAVADASVITTATRARVPFLDVDLVRKDAHVNAIGAITPERREVTDALVARCGIVVADDPSTATRATTELGAAPVVQALADVIVTPSPRNDGVPTMFKAMGVGLADVALGAALLPRVVADGCGRPLAQPMRFEPTMFRRRR